MKTRCPECQTVFRVTPEQLKARAGKVRCGHCQAVFDALDSLLETPVAPLPPPAAATVAPAIAAEPEHPLDLEPTIKSAEAVDVSVEAMPSVAEEEAASQDDILLKEPGISPAVVATDSLILPRDTTEIPGYSKWAEGLVTENHIPPESKRPHWLFALAAVLLVLGLAGQATYHFRSELAVWAPRLRPALETFSLALGSPLPLPAYIDLIGIETTDLQTDAARGNLLVLNATLRNRAPYDQAYPSLELSLTDTQDVTIARRVFAPRDYLPASKAPDKPFAGNSDLAVRLWIEAKDISAAGYRLFVFYP